MRGMYNASTRDACHESTRKKSSKEQKTYLRRRRSQPQLKQLDTDPKKTPFPARPSAPGDATTTVGAAGTASTAATAATAAAPTPATVALDKSPAAAVAIAGGAVAAIIQERRRHAAAGAGEHARHDDGSPVSGEEPQTETTVDARLEGGSRAWRHLGYRQGCGPRPRAASLDGARRWRRPSWRC